MTFKKVPQKRKTLTGENVADKIIGEYRYWLYYSKIGRWFIRKHILDQYEVRVNSIKDSICFSNGSCKHCGCRVTPLQFVGRSCEEPCYPRMVNKSQWKDIKAYGFYNDLENNILWKYDYINRRFERSEDV